MKFNKKSLILAAIGICAIMLTGCSEDKGKIKSDSYARVPKLFAEMKRGRVEDYFKKLDKETMQQAVREYDGYVAAYNNLAKAGGKSQEQMRKQLLPQAKDTLDKLKVSREKIKQEQPIVMTEDYLVYSKQYLDRAIERLELAIKQAEEKDTKKAAEYRNKGWFLEARLVQEARYGYMNASSMLFNHEKSSNINLAGFRAIKKGYTYENIMHIVRMPGSWLTTIVVPKGLKKDHHQQAVWSDGREMIYVEFINGKANSWKYYRMHNGFEYKEEH